MITEQHIKAKIKDAIYVVMPDGRTTICQLQLVSGFSVIGISVCMNAGDFNLQVGREIAYNDAFQKVWELEDYLAMNQKPMIKLPVVDSMVKKVTRVAKYGYKADGTPKKKPGRPRKEK